jgi:hypothetical protein
MNTSPPPLRVCLYLINSFQLIKNFDKKNIESKKEHQTKTSEDHFQN